MVHVRNVEEARLANFLGYAFWHFDCVRCPTRCRMKAGAGEVNCAKCKAIYSVTANGQVFQHMPVASVASIPQKVSTKQKVFAGIGGMLGKAADALDEVEENRAGKRLREGLLSTGATLQNMPEHVLAATMASFLQKSAELAREADNWSLAGRLKVGDEMQEEAKKRFDFNQSESCALWLAGAWLESGSRKTAEAAFVRASLDDFRQRFKI